MQSFIGLALIFVFLYFFFLFMPCIFEICNCGISSIFIFACFFYRYIYLLDWFVIRICGIFDQSHSFFLDFLPLSSMGWRLNLTILDHYCFFLVSFPLGAWADLLSLILAFSSHIVLVYLHFGSMVSYVICSS